MNALSIRKHIKDIMKTQDPNSETYHVLYDLSNWIKDGINAEYGERNSSNAEPVGCIETTYVDYGEHNFYEHTYGLKAEYLSHGNGIYIYKLTREQLDRTDANNRIECIVELDSIPKSDDLRKIWETALKSNIMRCFII